MSPDVDVFDLMDLPEPKGMNEDLAAWATEHEAQPAARTKGTPRVQGRCMSCSKAAEAICLRCEKAACARHRHVMTGLCDGCTVAQERSGFDTSATLEISGGEYDNGRRDDLGISWVD